MSSYRSIFTITSHSSSVVEEICRILTTWVADEYTEELGERGLEGFGPGMRFAPSDALELIWADETLESGDRLVGFAVIDHNGAVGADGTEEVVYRVVLGRGPEAPLETLVSIEIGPEAPRDENGHRILPQFVTDILTWYPCQDHDVRLYDGAGLTVAENVESLIELLARDDHHVPVVVATIRNGGSLKGQTWAIESMLEGAAGAYGALVLSQKAAARFNLLVGSGHSVPNLGLRVFFPGIRVKDETDAERHLRISSAQLSSAVFRQDMAEQLCDDIITHVSGARLSERESRYLDVMDRVLDRLFQGGDPAEPDSQQVAGADTAARLRQRVSELEAELAQGEAARQELQVKLDVAGEEISALAKAKTALESTLSELQRPGSREKELRDRLLQAQSKIDDLRAVNTDQYEKLARAQQQKREAQKRAATAERERDRALSDLEKSRAEARAAESRPSAEMSPAQAQLPAPTRPSVKGPRAGSKRPLSAPAAQVPTAAVPDSRAATPLPTSLGASRLVRDAWIDAVTGEPMRPPAQRGSEARTPAHAAAGGAVPAVSKASAAKPEPQSPAAGRPGVSGPVPPLSPSSAAVQRGGSAATAQTAGPPSAAVPGPRTPSADALSDDVRAILSMPPSVLGPSEQQYRAFDDAFIAALAPDQHHAREIHEMTVDVDPAFFESVAKVIVALEAPIAPKLFIDRLTRVFSGLLGSRRWQDDAWTLIASARLAAIDSSGFIWPGQLLDRHTSVAIRSARLRAPASTRRLDHVHPRELMWITRSVQSDYPDAMADKIIRRVIERAGVAVGVISSNDRWAVRAALNPAVQPDRPLRLRALAGRPKY